MGNRVCIRVAPGPKSSLPLWAFLRLVRTCDTRSSLGIHLWATWASPGASARSLAISRALPAWFLEVAANSAPGFGPGAAPAEAPSSVPQEGPAASVLTREGDPPQPRRTDRRKKQGGTDKFLSRRVDGIAVSKDGVVTLNPGPAAQSPRIAEDAVIPSCSRKATKRRPKVLVQSKPLHKFRTAAQKLRIQDYAERHGDREAHCPLCVGYSSACPLHFAHFHVRRLWLVHGSWGLRSG